MKGKILNYLSYCIINSFLFVIQVVIQGTRGTNDRGDIAIDDVSLASGSCQGINCQKIDAEEVEYLGNCFRCTKVSQTLC